MIVRFITKAMLLGVRWGIARYVSRHVHGVLWTTEQRLRIYYRLKMARLRRKRAAKQAVKANKERRPRRWIAVHPAWKRRPKP